MKKLMCVVLGFAMGGVVSAGQGYTDNSGDHSWDTVANWSQGEVIDDSTTDPSLYVPQWANAIEFRNNARMDIGPGEARQSYAFQMGVYGADNTVLNMSGGTLTVGNWGMDIGRGDTNNGGHDGDATINMTGGVIDAPYILVGNDFNPDAPATTVSDIEGTINGSGGVINSGFMRIGMNESIGNVNLSGNMVVNLSNLLQMNTGSGGWNNPDSSYGASLTLNDTALLSIGASTNADPVQRAQEVAEEMGIYQLYEDFGWISSSAPDVAILYNEANDTIDIYAVPEPATMSLLGLGGISFLRRRMRQ